MPPPCRVEDAAPAAVGRAAVALSPGMSGGEALQTIGLACLDRIQRNEAAAIAGLPEGIHRMRVGVRRLRALLTAFGPLLPAGERRSAADELRWLADVLAAVRNLDVLESGVIAPARAALGEVAGLAALRAAAARRRRAAHIAAETAIHSPRYAAMMLRLRHWFEAAGWRAAAASPPLPPLDVPILELAPIILDRRRRVARRRGKRFARQTPAQRHRLRIALKKLRYAAELLGNLYDPAAVGQITKPLKRLQDDLGEANDLRVGREILPRLAARRSDPGELAAAVRAVLGWHRRRLAGREAATRKRLDALFDAPRFWRD